jgi:hypothetical protein
MMKRIWVWVVSIGIVILALGGTLLYLFVWRTPREADNTTTSDQKTSPTLTIPQKVLDNKFGFLGGGIGETEGITERGAAWIRPHPGPFVWDMMQESEEAEIDFELADEVVSAHDKAGLGTLATLWPFADWDQLNLANSPACKVSDNDEFLPTNDIKGRGVYLPHYRCNPSDWTAYEAWVQAIVERYDGDGVNDMPGLEIPIKHWEVMNEPDLTYQSDLPQDELSRLNFYKQGPAEYATLLQHTYNAIKTADPDSYVVIAGAAGGNDQFLAFYEEVFNSMADAENYFDIGNVHCISNDRETRDYNVGVYKQMLSMAGIDKPIWVTEAEAFYGATAEENYQNTLTSTQGAITAGAQRIFYTRYLFEDTRKDMSQMLEPSKEVETDSQEKYITITDLFND